MGVGRSSIALANNLTLTGAYAILGEAFRISDESLCTLDITYTTGAAESNNEFNFILEFSYDGVNNWVQESLSNISGSTDTLTPVDHKVSGAAATTAYTGQYVLPLCSRFVRVKGKETGVAANFGTATMISTRAPASGQSRNLETGGAINQGAAGVDPWLVKQQQPASSSVTSVASSAASVTLLASNANRKQATIYNDSTQILFLKLGAIATNASYTVQLNANDYYELPSPAYTGIVDGIWAAANGNARITELT